MLSDRSGDDVKEDREIATYFGSIIQRYKPDINKGDETPPPLINDTQITNERAALFERLHTENQRAYERLDQQFFDGDRPPTRRIKKKKKNLFERRIQPQGFEVVLWPARVNNDIDDGPPPNEQ